jgi:hypothetical protein
MIRFPRWKYSIASRRSAVLSGVPVVVLKSSRAMQVTAHRRIFRARKNDASWRSWHDPANARQVSRTVAASAASAMLLNAHSSGSDTIDASKCATRKAENTFKPFTIWLPPLSVRDDWRRAGFETVSKSPSPNTPAQTSAPHPYPAACPPTAGPRPLSRFL